MKTLRKLLVLAPVMVMSLTACEAKIDEAKASERAKGYNATEVAKEYKSFDQKSTCKVNKNTGVFADGGLYGALIIPLLKEALNTEEKDLPADQGVYTTAAFAELMSAANTEDNAKTTISYYAYKDTGLKIVGEAKAEESSEGIKSKGTSKVEMYVLDDGRIEKGSGYIKMSMSGSSSGVKVDGELDMSFNITYTWHRA